MKEWKEYLFKVNGFEMRTGREIKLMKPGLWMLIFGACIFFGFAVIRNIMVYQFGYDYLGDLNRYTK